MPSYVVAFARREGRDDFEVVFGNEGANGEFALDQHGQRRGLDAAHGKFLAAGEGVGARQIHANQPVGAAAAASSVGQRIVFAARRGSAANPSRMASGVREEIHSRLNGLSQPARPRRCSGR